MEHEVKDMKDELKEFRKEQKEQHTSMMDCIHKIDKRIEILERWRWMITGGALVVGYLVAQVVQLAKVLS